MNEANSSTSTEVAGQVHSEDGPPPCTLSQCCQNTIAMHAAFNPMMVCPNCKRLIKCFTDMQAYRNYLRFCESRQRKVQTSRVGPWDVIAFRAYQTYP